VKSGGDGTTYLPMELVNSGTVRIERGVLALSRGYVQSGGGGVSGPVSVSNPGPTPLPPSPTPPVVTSYTQTSTGSLIEQIGGPNQGDYGQIIVNGSVNLDGG